MPTVTRQSQPPQPTRRVVPAKLPAGKTTEAEAILARLQPISFDEDDGIQVLLYGRSGTGKTTLWSTFPGPIVAMICSGGMNPGELRSVAPEQREGISNIVLHKSTDMDVIVEAVRTGRVPCSTIVLDHASGLQDLTLKEILGVDQLPAQRRWGDASRQQYGQSTMQCKELLRRMLGLPKCNIVIVAQERSFGDDENADQIAPHVGPGMSPSLAAWLNPAVDYIGNTYIRQKEEVTITKLGTGKDAKELRTRTKLKGQVEYCLRTVPDPVYMTKFRVPKGRMNEDIVDPDYTKIMALIRGENPE